MLTDTAIRNAKAIDKPYKLQDSQGLYILIKPNGGKYFRFNYRFGDKRQTLSLGVYPAVSLKEARTKRDTAKKQINGGINPAVQKQALKLAKTQNATNSFEAICLEWLVGKCNDKSPRPKRQLNFFIPYIGATQVTEIRPTDILKCLNRVSERGTVYSAKKALQMLGQVFCYAVATGRAERDITQVLKGALPSHTKKHFAAITEPKEIGDLMRDIYGYSGTSPVTAALRLLPLLFQRPGELRAMKWADVDLEAREWRYLVTKTNISHIVPLSHQAITILEEIKPLTGHGSYVFPSERTPNG
jgi:integrase